jgi:predicted nucleic acid-binding protein
MAINYTIRANVIDIRIDSPKASDVFLIDSNVWYWMTYPNASQSAIPYQLSDYPDYINRALISGSRLYWSGLSLAELSHLIERTERQIYERINGSIKTKEYRHNLASDRARIVLEIQASWGQVKSLAAPLALSIDEATTDRALNRLQTQLVDGYDLFILETMAKHGVIQIITDDGDFSTITGIQIFTSNRHVLNSARIQGKELKR